MKSERAINITKGCVMASFMDSEKKQMVIEALNQVAISKTETDGCDDLYSQCGECGQFYLENRGYDYCPYCGRRLEDDNG